MTKALDWVHVASTIGDRSLSETREASADERQELARMLDILSCDALKVSYTLTPLKAGRFRLTGTLDAKVTQACVVTLEPVPSSIEERFAIELYPAGEARASGSAEGEQEVLSTPDIEPFEDGRIDVGDLVYELLSAALDPYPRKEGVEFDWVDPKTAADPGAVSPFAALAKLKPKV
jgi:uncharacterized metal-binding protein YceD (DUF177 family)